MIQVLACAHASGGFDLCFNIRLEVFVNEQKIPLEEERDAWDDVATHYLALQDCVPAGTARAVMKEPGLVKIGRVAVLPQYRKRGIGAALLRAVEAAHPGAVFVLDAQIRSMQFYQTLGYVAQGEVFDDAGIPHRKMLKQASDITL